MQECREYNLCTPKTSNVKVEEKVSESVVNEHVSKVQTGRSNVHAKATSQNVNVKTFCTKNPKEKHQQVEIGLLKFVDPKGIVKEKDNESVKKGKVVILVEL